MKAAVVESPNTVVIHDVPEPTVAPYEARCEILYGTLCAGTDTHLIGGHMPFCKWVKHPFILGHESIGRVTEHGEKVRNLKVGDIVTRVNTKQVGEYNLGWGGFAQVGIATDWQAMKEDGVEGWQTKRINKTLPPDIDPMIAPLFITWRETYSYTERIGVKPSTAILIIGTGGNALAFASHAKNLGANNITIVGSANRESQAKLAGVNHFYNYKDESSWQQAIEQTQDAAGYDIVIDSLGKQTTVHNAQHCLKPEGIIGIYGFDEPDGFTLKPGKSFSYFKTSYDEASAHETVLKHCQAGELNPDVWLDREHIFALDHINDAIAAVHDRSQVKPLIRISE